MRPARRQSRLPNCLNILASAALLLSCSVARGEEPPRLLLDERYPIEAVVSFHASLLHWLDSLTGISGAGLTGGKTRRVHRIEYSHVHGSPSDSERTILQRYAEARLGFAERAREDDPDAVTLAFFESPTTGEAMRRTRELVGDSDADAIAEALAYFAGKYEPIWKNGLVPERFYERTTRSKQRKKLARFMVDVADFFGVPPDREPVPRLLIMPVPDGAGTHAQAFRNNLLIEVRHWESLVDETAPIVHENVHLLFYRMGPERVTQLARTAAESGPLGAEAWTVLHEALPTAIGQGIAYQRFQPERWSISQRWYHIETIDRYAKQIYPVIRDALRSGRALDEPLVLELVELYERE